MYRADCRAQAGAGFAAKPGLVEEDGDETLFWCGSYVEARILPANKTEALLMEARELLAVFLMSRRTALVKERTRQRPELLPDSLIS